MMENRYSRQMAYFGKVAQQKIGNSKVCIIGCGALGSSSAELLARAGVGKIKLVDRDFVELSNLQRQHLFDEDDIDKSKSAALTKKLKKINSLVEIGFEVADFNPMNAESLIEGFDLIIDGLDNMYSRFILNEACAKVGVPWVYGSAIRNAGYASFIDPKRSCLRCFIRNTPSETDTCEISGVTNSITSLISAVQAGEAISCLSGKTPCLSGKLLHADMEKMYMKTFGIKKDPKCAVCSQGKFAMLGKPASNSISLCGNDSYHISPPSKTKLELKGAAMRLPKEFSVKSANRFLLRAVSEEDEITIFSDGRMITRGLKKADAEKLYRKVVLI